MKTKAKPRTPSQARTFNQICDLESDGCATGDFWLSLGAREVVIHEQAVGEESKQKIKIPRHVFEKFIRWYQTGSVKP